MHNDTQINLAQHRMETAEEKLKASKLLLSGGLYKDSIGRSYYAIFQKDYVKEGVFDKQYSKIIMEAF